jgi:3-oxoacyl-[acyl-carrier protein] reductase
LKVPDIILDFISHNPRVVDSHWVHATIKLKSCELAPLEAITLEHVLKQFNLNFVGLIQVTQEDVTLTGSEGGTIISIGSIVGPTSAPQATAYSTTKAAVDTISVSLSQELGPRKIRVNSLNPGMIETEGLRAAGLNEKAFREQQDRKTPLGRISQPDDIAPAATCLASDDARWITGQAIIAAGGKWM